MAACGDTLHCTNVDAGVFVAVAAGNDGPLAGTVGNPGTMPWMTTVGASTQSRFFKGDILLGDGRTLTGASITPGVSEREGRLSDDCPPPSGASGRW